MELIDKIERVTTRFNGKVSNAEILADDWRDAAGRFNTWSNVLDVGTAGSSNHQTLLRLYLSSHLATAVETLLDGLLDLFSDISPSDSDSDVVTLGLTTHDAPRSLSRASSPSAPSDDVEAETAETEYNLLDAINHILSGLDTLTPALLNPAPHDAITRPYYSRIALTQETDTKHLDEKFPEAPISLRQRLGRLNWHRRILRECAKMHKQSDTVAPENVADPIAEQAFSDGQPSSQPRPPASIAPTSIMNTNSMAATQTNVSTEPSTLPSSESIFDAPQRDNHSQSSVGSISTYAATVRPQDDKHIPCPRPPPGCLEGQPFDCQICHRRITNVKGNRKWKRHVMQDLRPYVCTYEGCRIQDVMFASRREWFEHEMTFHSISYVCIPPCQDVFASYIEFYRHLNDSHSVSISDQQVEHIAAFRKRCDFPDGGVLCPLCQEPCPTMKKLEKHLGGDLEQIALFSLPLMAGDADVFDHNDDDDDDEDEDDTDALSVASSEEMDVEGKMALFDKGRFGDGPVDMNTSSVEIRPEHVVLGIPYCRRSGKPEVPWTLKDFNDERPYSCTSLCGQQFSVKAKWKAHEELNFPRAWWLCKFCADIFPRKDRLRDHKKKQHGQSKVDTDEQHATKQREEFSGTCFFDCGYADDSFDQWIDHLDKHFHTISMNWRYNKEIADADVSNVLSMMWENQQARLSTEILKPSDMDQNAGPWVVSSRQPNPRTTQFLKSTSVPNNAENSSISSPSPSSFPAMPSPQRPWPEIASIERNHTPAKVPARQWPEIWDEVENAPAHKARSPGISERTYERPRQAGSIQPPSTSGPISSYFSDRLIESRIKYCFSAENLANNLHLRSNMDSGGWVSLDVVANLSHLDVASSDGGPSLRVKQLTEVVLRMSNDIIEKQFRETGLWYIRKAKGFEAWVLPEERLPTDGNLTDRVSGGVTDDNSEDYLNKEQLQAQEQQQQHLLHDQLFQQYQSLIQQEQELRARLHQQQSEQKRKSMREMVRLKIEADRQIAESRTSEAMFLQKPGVPSPEDKHAATTTSSNLDTASWPTLESAALNKRHEVSGEEKTDQSDRKIDSTRSRTNRWQRVPFVPTVQFDTLIPAADPKRSNRAVRYRKKEIITIQPEPVITHQEKHTRETAQDTSEKKEPREQTAHKAQQASKSTEAGPPTTMELAVETASQQANPGSKVAEVLLADFREFRDAEMRKLVERKKARDSYDKTAKLNDLKRFSKDFELKMPMPSDLVGILAKDPDKQKAIIEKNSTWGPR